MAKMLLVLPKGAFSYQTKEFEANNKLFLSQRELFLDQKEKIEANNKLFLSQKELFLVGYRWFTIWCVNFWDAQRQEGKIIIKTHRIMDGPGNIHVYFENPICPTQATIAYVVWFWRVWLKKRGREKRLGMLTQRLSIRVDFPNDKIR